MSVFFVIYLAVFGTSVEGLPQVTLLKKFESSYSCKKEIEKMQLEDKEKETIGCVRMLKGDAKWREA